MQRAWLHLWFVSLYRVAGLLPGEDPDDLLGCAYSHAPDGFVGVCPGMRCDYNIVKRKQATALQFMGKGVKPGGGKRTAFKSVVKVCFFN